MTRQEQLSCLTDRPCAVCKYRSDKGCSQWNCVFEEQPCEDAISRQAAINAVRTGALSTATLYGRTEKGETARKEIERLINALPSVSTENLNNCDLISREWLKTAIHNFYYGLTHTPTEEDIQAYIDAAPSVNTEKTGRWIPVSERLPERDVDVLAYHRNESFDYQRVSWIDDYSGEWAGFIGSLSDKVLAWMPLPQPYKGESDGSDETCD